MNSKVIFPAELPRKNFNKMSVVQLENCVSYIVKRWRGNGANTDHRGSKPKWWPVEVAFCCPVVRRNATDDKKWREILLDVIARCCMYKKQDCNAASKTSRRKLRNNTRNQNQTTKIVNEEYNYDNLLSEIERKISKRKKTINLSNFNPVVSLYDITKHKCKVKSPTTKNEFLNYFKLTETDNSSVIMNNGVYKRIGNPVHLINSQNLPFSSDLGMKLTKECHIVPLAIHQRKIERTERFLTHTVTTDNSKSIEYEVIYNKHSNWSHNYTFPSRQFRKIKEPLSTKATFLLTHTCKPCSVTLESLKIAPNTNTVDNLLNTNKPDQNIIQENSPRENFSVPEENYKLINEDLVLRTKNENCVPNRQILYAESTNDCENNVNKSTVQPIDSFFEMQNTKIINYTNKNKKKTTKIKNKRPELINKVQKRRILVYHPRRFSLRLRYVTNSNKS